MKILVADDSKTNLILITGSLEKLGHQVIPVKSGEEAIEAFKQERPDLIILDVVMGEMGGFECAKRIREINSEDWIPIIFLSATVDDTSIAEGIDAGGDDYLTKPFSEITLAAKIKAMQRISDMRKKLFETTQKLALLSATDPLTGIYNRLQFDKSLLERVSLANRHQRLLALLFIDLDKFKIINDSFGHHVGDLLLKEVASRLLSCLREYDFIARIGGDEFAIILEDIDSPEDAGRIAQKLIDILSPDYYLDNHNIRIGASIGIACYPTAGMTLENIVQNADIAMYHAKESGRNNYQYFTDELNEKYKHHLNLEHALQFALERKEMYLTYQPIFDLNTKAVVGMEALVGWEHPKFGIISPNIFIPIAEETGLISSIGNWVFRTVCEQAKKLDISHFKKFKLAINLSSHQLNQENFLEMVTDTLKTTKIPPHIIEFELTENTVMGYTSRNFKDTLKKFHNLGISLAIDDFGTGYSSLTRLKQVSVNTLKIDKIFIQDSVTDMNSAIIVNCLIALGKNLGLNVIAEGIETHEQLDFLIAKGCTEGQGYYLSKPMTIEKITEYFKKMKERA